jgi:hypothetical protein
VAVERKPMKMTVQVQRQMVVQAQVQHTENQVKLIEILLELLYQVKVITAVQTTLLLLLMAQAVVVVLEQLAQMEIPAQT